MTVCDQCGELAMNTLTTCDDCRRSNEEFYDGCMRHMWVPGYGACPACADENEKQPATPESGEE